MSSDRQLNYVNDLQNRDQNLYYVDDASELNSINLKENDKIYAINDNKLFQMEIVDQEEELSGSIVSFNGRNNTKIKSLATNIEPVQDLHGYDNPWPGGAGKNMSHLMIISSSGAKYKDLSDESVTVYSSLTAPAYRFCSFKLIDSVEELAGQTVSLSAKATQVQGPSSPRMICRLQKADGSSTVEDIIFDITSTNISQSFTLPSEIESGTILYLNLYCDGSSGGPSETKFYDIQLELGSSATTFVPYKNICPISGWTGVDIYHEAEYDADANPAISVTFPDEAGTVYGATMTLNPDRTGTLVVDRAYYLLGALGWTMPYSGSFVCSARSIVPGVAGTVGSSNPMVCSDYPTKPTRSYISDYSDKMIGLSVDGAQIVLKDTSYTDVNTFKMAMANVQAVYSIAVPVVYTLTSEQVSGILTTLYGKNNIWSNTGDITVKIAEKGITAFELEPHI